MDVPSRHSVTSPGSFLSAPGGRRASIPGWELLDSRWNGNEALRWTTDRGPFFVKMNRVEDMSVFMTEVNLN